MANKKKCPICGSSSTTFHDGKFKCNKCNYVHINKKRIVREGILGELFE